MNESENDPTKASTNDPTNAGTTESVEDHLPKSRKNSWLWVYAVFASLAIIALILSMLYRQTTKPSQVLQKERMRNATRTSFAIVFSKVPIAIADTIVDHIVSAVGADSTTTDLVLGTTVTDPYCASVAEYRSMLHKAMRETGELRIGDQTLIVSKVAGIMIKNEHPTVVYLIGTLTGDDLSRVGRRTEQSASAIMTRSKLMGPVRIVSMLQPPHSPIHDEYVNIYRKAGLDVTAN